jgi:hypothetical protein
MLSLNIGSFAPGHGYGLSSAGHVEVPIGATVDELITKLAADFEEENRHIVSNSEGEGDDEDVPDDEDDENLARVNVAGCSGFLAAPKLVDRDEYDYDYDSEDEGSAPSVLAAKLTAQQGVLLQPGHTLSSYGLDQISCVQVILFPVFGDAEKQPTVYQADIRKTGFGTDIYKYVKLHQEDKELLHARQCFRGALFRGLQQDKQVSQTLTFSMEDNFAQAPRSICTVQLVNHTPTVDVSCTNLAGDLLCSVAMTVEDSIASMKEALCKELRWTSMVLWDSSEKVSDASKLSNYTVLTAEQTITNTRITGCYQHSTHNVRPAGYSASSTTYTEGLVLEPGKASLFSSFKGDYKRASELLKLVMPEARWSIEKDEQGEHIVKIVGEATLDRHFCHERSGSDGVELEGYKCQAMVTIPVQELERGHKEDHHVASTKGSGWTCGSEEYKCSFFLPMSLLSVVRQKTADMDDAFLLRQLLNEGEASNYPLNSAEKGGYRRAAHRNITRNTVDIIKYFRQKLEGKPEVSVREILELQSSAPNSRPQAQDESESESQDEE